MRFSTVAAAFVQCAPPPAPVSHSPQEIKDYEDALEEVQKGGGFAGAVADNFKVPVELVGL